MRQKTQIFQVNGMPLLVPDGNVEILAEDLLSPESGRDESGALHRFVLRPSLLSWQFSYRTLTQEEKEYLENLFPEGEPFSFSYPAGDGTQTQSLCYRTDREITWRNARTGLWQDCGFRIVQC